GTDPTGVARLPLPHTRAGDGRGNAYARGGATVLDGPTTGVSRRPGSAVGDARDLLPAPQVQVVHPGDVAAGQLHHGGPPVVGADGGVGDGLTAGLAQRVEPVLRADGQDIGLPRRPGTQIHIGRPEVDVGEGGVAAGGREPAGRHLLRRRGGPGGGCGRCRLGGGGETAEGEGRRDQGGGGAARQLLHEVPRKQWTVTADNRRLPERFAPVGRYPAP